MQHDAAQHRIIPSRARRRNKIPSALYDRLTGSGPVHFCAICQRICRCRLPRSRDSDLWVTADSQIFLRFCNARSPTPRRVYASAIEAAQLTHIFCRYSVRQQHNQLSGILFRYRADWRSTSGKNDKLRSIVYLSVYLFYRSSRLFG